MIRTYINNLILNLMFLQLTKVFFFLIHCFFQLFMWIKIYGIVKMWDWFKFPVQLIIVSDLLMIKDFENLNFVFLGIIFFMMF